MNQYSKDASEKAKILQSQDELLPAADPPASHTITSDVALNGSGVETGVESSSNENQSSDVGPDMPAFLQAEPRDSEPSQQPEAESAETQQPLENVTEMPRKYTRICTSIWR